MIPIEDIEKIKNGFGRDSPNQWPTLSEPVGRLKFDIANPLNFIKDIIGPDLYSKCVKWSCFILIFVFLITFGW